MAYIGVPCALENGLQKNGEKRHLEASVRRHAIAKIECIALDSLDGFRMFTKVA